MLEKAGCITRTPAVSCIGVADAPYGSPRINGGCSQSGLMRESAVQKRGACPEIFSLYESMRTQIAQFRMCTVAAGGQAPSWSLRIA